LDISEAIEMADNPSFCQYASGPCDQDLRNLGKSRAFFVYPGEPRPQAHTSRLAVQELQRFTQKGQWIAWEDLPISGRIIFCEICKAQRGADKVIGDITNLNFNVLFEIGFALGLRKPVLPVRDTSFKAEHLASIGFFDVLGYADFQNSRELAGHAQFDDAKYPFSASPVELHKTQPIYYISSPIESDGSIKILSCLKKGYFRFRLFDPLETPRLSLHDAHRQVLGSVGVVAQLMDPNRVHADMHNGRAAFICGMAMAAGKRVLMIQEGFHPQPVDYRDVVTHYDDPSNIPSILEKFYRSIAEAFQSQEFVKTRPTNVLESIDLGDVAAENEIESLKLYFVKTPQYQQTIQGHTQIVVGRKGAGKTAIFYMVRDALHKAKAGVVLDLKPDGHQLIKLREAIVEKLSEGFQNHTLAVFWEYLLILEIARKLLDRDSEHAYANPQSLDKYKALEAAYRMHVTDQEGDFSERILALVDRMIGAFEERSAQGELKTSDITAVVYKSDINAIRAAILTYLSRSEEIWILFDNIDKGWPARGTKSEDITIVRCLLEASRKIQRTFGLRGQEAHTIVFLRKDVHDLLVDLTPDRGKEAAVNLDWSDPGLVRSLVSRRIKSSSQLDGDLDSIWMRMCDPHVKGNDSFRYILDRTFLRPRDVLNFTRLAIQIGVSRDHQRVEEEDFLAAERIFSEDMTNDLRHEIRDVLSVQQDILSAFAKSSRVLSEDDVRLTLIVGNIEEAMADRVIDTLLWFSFLGVVTGEDERYSYQLSYNVERLRAVATRSPSLRFVIHPAFHTALEIQS
jgi:hypothetical protein